VSLADGTCTTVLVVEDEAITRMALVAELERHGFAVLEAADGRHAVDLFRSNPQIGAAVVDIGLPGEINGYDVVKAIRSERPDLTMIIASGQKLRMPDDFDEHVLVEEKPYDAVKITLILEERLSRS
jgi:CheY-like chemotaxis protein